MSVDTFKSILSEFYQEPLLETTPREIELPLGSGQIVSVIGCRRAGKTTLLRQLIRKILSRGVKVEQVVFINFEDERIPRDKASFEQLLIAHAELFPGLDSAECWYFFDEIQEMPEWEKFVRRLHETRSKNIFLSGSNAKFLSREIATILRGRTISFDIYPFSFREYLIHKKINPEKRYSARDKAVIRSNFKEYLLRGGYPETINQAPSIRQKIFRSYLDVMIYRDIIERYNVKNHEALKAFIKKGMANIAREASVHKTYLELKSAGFEISKDLLYKLSEWCEEIFLLFRLTQYHESVNKEISSAKKIYCVDNGMVTSTSFRSESETGRLLENCIFMELKRRGNEFYYNKVPKECDFIILENEEIKSTIQVTTTLQDPSTKQRELEGIIQTLRKTKHVEKAIIITLDEEDTIKYGGMTIEVIPAINWLLGKN